MSEQSTRYHVAPLQHIIAEPINDPAELAAIDEMRKQARDASTMIRTRGGVRTVDPSTAAASFLARWHASSSEEKGPLLARLFGELSDDDQLDLFAEVLERLSPVALRRLEDREGGTA